MEIGAATIGLIETQSTGAPRVGQKAPDFLLLDQKGKPVGLGDLLSNSKGVVVIFYRGFW
jgi:peroxiredoxin